MTTHHRPRRIAVVGAGVIGASIAARAAERGSDVLLLSAETAGTTAVSRASFAWVNSHGKAPGPYRRLNIDARRRHIELSKGHHRPWFVQTGSKVDDHHYPDDGYVDIRAFITAHLEGLAAAGGRVANPARIDSLDEVRRLHGPLDTIVVAAGTATSELVRSDGHRVARLSTSTGPDGFLARIDVGDHPIDRVLSTGGLQIRPDDHGRVAAQSLSIEDALKRAGLEPSVETVGPSLRAEIAAALGWTVPVDARMRVDQAARPRATDGLPVVGAVGEDVYVALTHSGVTLAPLLADLVVGDLHDDPDPRLTAFRPERSDHS